MNSMPVAASYKTVLDAFTARNISQLLAPDLAADFTSGEYTLRELGARYPGFEADIRAVNDELREAKSEVVAVVNGKSITREDLDDQIGLLPEQYRAALSDEQVLQEMINEELILQEGAARGLTATDAEIDEAYQALLVNGGLTEEQLLVNIGLLGLDKKDLRALLTRQLTISKVFAETVDKSVNVSEKEARNYYDENTVQFTMDEQVRVRHLLLAVAPPEQTDAEANALAGEALSKLQDGADFCALVDEYSDDAGSKASCGEYTFGRGFMVKEFEDASFSMQDGAVRVVKTSFGYHVIEKLEAIPGTVVSFDQAAAQIKEYLLSQKRLLAYKLFIDQLNAGAVIENRLVQPVEEEVDSFLEAADAAAPALVEVSVESPGEHAVTTTVTISSSLAECLTSKGVVLYTSADAPSSLDEPKKFGGDASALTVIDCTNGGATCAGVEFFPAWRIDGTLAYGGQTLEQLAAKSGCALG